MIFKNFLKKYEKKEVIQYHDEIIEKPLVSISVVTYQHLNFIRECLDGILMQETNFPFEILLGDDESTDGTREICLEYAKKYPHKIRLFLHHRENNIKINRNPTGRFNFLYNLYSAKGKYIAICEGDDYWTDPLKLQKQVDFLENNEEYILSFHKVDVLKSNGEIEKDYILKVPEDYETIETLALKGNYIHTPSVVYRNIIKTFPFEFLHAPFGDFLLYFLLAERGKLYYFKDNMAVYRQGVGILSKMSGLEIANNNMLLYSCMISFTKYEEVKKILFKRQMDVVTSHYNQIVKGPEYYFVSNHLIFKWIHFLKAQNKNPLYILSKLKKKLFQ